MQKIRLKHLKGARAESVDEFPIGDSTLILIGSASECQVRFEEPTVRPRHSTIEVKPGAAGAPDFVLGNADSASTTFLNKRLIFESAKLAPGDIIQFGRGGPEVEFDLEPREAEKAGRRPAFEQEHLEKPDVVRPLVLAVASAVGIVLFLALAAGAYVWIVRWKAERAAQTEPVEAVPETAATPVMLPPKPEEPVVQDYGHTVYVQSTWHAEFGPQSLPVYHKHFEVGGAKLPGFVRMPDQSLEPWLVLDDEDGLNPALGKTASAFAFLVDDRGYFLTTRQITAPLLAPYEFDLSLGIRLYSSSCLTPSCAHRDVAPHQLSNAGKALGRWTPLSARVLTRTFGPDQVRGQGDMKVKIEEISMRSAGSNFRYPAEAAGFSESSDVGLVKVEGMPLPAKVNLKSARTQVRGGDDVTVIGHPRIAASSIERFVGGEPDKDSPPPMPKASGGKIGIIIDTPDSRKIYVLDMYSKTELIPGAPVFLNSGEAIGVLTLSPTAADRNMLAVPIEYGLALIP